MDEQREGTVVFSTLDELEPLVTDENKYIQSYIKFTELTSAHCKFQVYDVSSWTYPEQTPIDGEFIFSCYFKFDGSSQYLMGDKDGYVALGNPETSLFMKAMKTSHNMAIDKMREIGNCCVEEFHEYIY